MIQQTETYRLCRVVSIYAIVTADHLTGIHAHFRSHSHGSAWELCHCISGQISALQDGKTLLLQPGQCLLIPPGVDHIVSTTTQDSEAVVLSFTCTDSYLTALRGLPMGTNPRQQQRFLEILRELRSAFTLDKDELRILKFRPSAHSPLGAEQLICCFLEEILIEMLRSAVQLEQIQHLDLEEAVQSLLASQVTAYIRANLGEELSVESIADHFHYSRNRLGILYKSATGTTLGKAITDQRIARAKELLAQGEKSITEIAGELGFSSPQYFSRKFSQEVGCAPSVYITDKTPGVS